MDDSGGAVDSNAWCTINMNIVGIKRSTTTCIPYFYTPLSVTLYRSAITYLYRTVPHDSDGLGVGRIIYKLVNRLEKLCQLSLFCSSVLG